MKQEAKNTNLNEISGFKLNFEYLCESYGIKRKPTTKKKPQANAILEHVHQVLTQMYAQLSSIWLSQ